MESIGIDMFDAINWLQDEYGYIRHVAEKIIVESIKTGKIIISENGVYLTESDEEFEENSKGLAHNISRKYSRTQFRNHNRIKSARKMANKMSSNNNGDEAADNMLRPIIEDDETDK
jgi:hypothetical protein